MIKRTAYDTITRLAKGFPVIAITGPRQSGKTTLARSAFPGMAGVRWHKGTCQREYRHRPLERKALIPFIGVSHSVILRWKKPGL